MKTCLLLFFLLILNSVDSYAQLPDSTLSIDSINTLIKSIQKVSTINDGMKLSARHISTDKKVMSSVRTTNSGQPIIDKELCLTSAYSVTVCADGSPAFLLKFFGGNPSHYYNFAKVRIKEGNSPDIYGEFINLNPTPDTLFATYKNPTTVPNTSQFNRLTIKVYLSFDNLPGYEGEMGTFPLFVHRPPVFMVHGLWSDPSAFEVMKTNFIKDKFYTDKFIKIADYSSTNAEHFSVNQQRISNQINDYLFSLRSQESCIGVTKVDYVAHSMGGIIGRLYLQSDSYQDNIYRMITINTPHSGSQLANVLLSPQRAPNNTIACALLPFDPTSTLPYNVPACTSGGVDDLRVDSDAIRVQLNGPRKNYHVVPSHAVTTTADYISIYLDGPLKKGPIGTLYGRLNEFLLAISCQDVFGEENDQIVALSSQQGGLPCTSLIRGQIHTASPENQQVINRVYTMLLDKPTSAWFCTSGFNPPVLNPPHLNPIFSGGRQSGGKSDNLSIKITSPSKGVIVNAGSRITVNVSGSGIHDFMTFIDFEADSSFLAWQSGTNATYNIPISNKAVGKKKIITVAKTSSGQVIVDTTFFYVVGSCSSTKSGNWNDLSNWSCGHEPTVNDIAIINSAHTINVTTKTAYARKVVYNGGNVKFLYPGTRLSIGLDFGIVEPPNTININNFNNALTLLSYNSNARLSNNVVSFDYNATNGSQSHVWATNPMSFTNGFETSFTFSVEVGQYVAFRMSDLVDNTSKYIGLTMSTTSTSGFSHLPAEFVSGSNFKSILDNQVHTAKIVVENTYYGAFTVDVYLDGPSSFYGTPLFSTTAYTLLPAWFNTPKLIGISAFNNPVGNGKLKIYSWTVKAL